MDKAPLIPRDILDYLQAQFPDRCPDLNLSDREYGAYFGARQLIRHLEQLFQNQTGLDEEPVTFNSRTRRRR